MRGSRQGLRRTLIAEGGKKMWQDRTWMEKGRAGEVGGGGGQMSD